MNPCTCGGHCAPGQGCRSAGHRSGSRRIHPRWYEIVGIVGLLAFGVYEWREMCIAGEQCFIGPGWF